MTVKTAKKRINIIFANSDIEVLKVECCQSSDVIFPTIRNKGTFGKGKSIEIQATPTSVYLAFSDNHKNMVGKFKKVHKNSELFTFERNPKFWETLSKILLQ